MSESQEPQTPISRLEQLERQIASKFESLLQGVREELGEGVRLAGEEIQEFVQSARRRAEEATEEAEEARREAKRAAEEAEQAEKSETAERPAPDAGETLASLVDGLARIDGEFGQADVVQALLAESRRFSSRAAFFLIRQGQLRAWSSVGFGAGGGRLEGLQAATDEEPWSTLGASGTSRALDAELGGRVAKTLGVEPPTQAAWIPFVLRGQLAGALYADRVEGDGALGVSGLQILTLGAARSLETAAANPEVSPSLELEGELPELPVDERTVAVPEEGAEAREEPVPEAPELEEIEAPAVETPEVAVPTVEVPEVEMPTAESAAAPPEEAAEDEIPEPEEEAAAEEAELEEEEEPTDVAVEAASDDAAAATAPSVPDVETLEEAPAFEMVEEEAVEEEAEEERAEAQVLEEQAAAPTPDVPEVELGAPEPTLGPEAEAEAPEVPEVEVGEPGEVSPGDIEFEAEPEAPLDEETDIWEVEEEEEPTAVGVEEAKEEAVEVAAPEVSAEDIEPEDVEPPAAPASPDAVSPPRETPAQPGGAQPGYPTSFAEEPPPVSAPPPATTFAGEEEEATEEPAPPSQVTPPADMQSSAEVTPPAAEAPSRVTPPEAEPSAEVTPPQPAAPSPEPPSPEAPSPEETPASQVTPPPDAEPRSETAGSTEVKPPSDLDGPGLAFASPPPGQQAAEVDDAEEALHEEARRLARLLVSEIKLYNEEVIEEGRRAGNIYERLKDDIDRSRQMYEERIDPRLADQEDYFYQELVQRLAGGDKALLGL